MFKRKHQKHKPFHFALPMLRNGETDVDKFYEAVDYTMLSPTGRGFRQASEKANRDRLPTMLESLAEKAGIHKHKKRDTSARGDRRRKARALHRRTSGAAQAVLNAYRQEPGASRNARMKDLKRNPVWVKKLEVAIREAHNA